MNEWMDAAQKAFIKCLVARLILGLNSSLSWCEPRPETLQQALVIRRPIQLNQAARLATRQESTGTLEWANSPPLGIQKVLAGRWSALPRHDKGFISPTGGVPRISAAPVLTPAPSPLVFQHLRRNQTPALLQFSSSYKSGLWPTAGIRKMRMRTNQKPTFMASSPLAPSWRPGEAVWCSKRADLL